MSARVRDFQYAEISLDQVIGYYQKHVLSPDFSYFDNGPRWFVDVVRGVVIYRTLAPVDAEPETVTTTAVTCDNTTDDGFHVRVWSRDYKATVERGEHNYSAFSPEVPGCVATGKVASEALINLAEAIAFHLEEREDIKR